MHIATVPERMTPLTFGRFQGGTMPQVVAALQKFLANPPVRGPFEPKVAILLIIYWSAKHLPLLDFGTATYASRYYIHMISGYRQYHVNLDVFSTGRWYL